MVQRSQLHGRVTAILDASRARLPLEALALVTALAPLAGSDALPRHSLRGCYPVTMQPGVALTASFSSVELRNGGKVNLVHGQSQGVTLLKGDPEQASITIRDNGRLVIDRCPTHCPRNHDFEVEVVTPASRHCRRGGRHDPEPRRVPASARDRRRRQPGRHDRYPLRCRSRTSRLRCIAAAGSSPGRGAALSANVEQGGNITYWGDPVVKSSVRYGGVVVRGRRPTPTSCLRS